MFSLDVDVVAAEWCSRLPPGSGPVDSLCQLFRGLMRPPRLEITREALEIWPDCPGLAIPRDALPPELRAAVASLAEREIRGETAFFSRRVSDAVGNYRLAGFSRGRELEDAVDARALVEALTRALLVGAGDRLPDVQEACRAGIQNALASEPLPEPPAEVEALRARYEAAVEAETTDWEPEPEPAPRAAAREAPRVRARFLRAFPTRTPGATEEQPYLLSECLSRDLEVARRRERAHERALNLRLFMRALSARVLEWR